MRRSVGSSWVGLFGSWAVWACTVHDAPHPAPPVPTPAPIAAPAPAPVEKRYDALERATFNLLAQRANMPIFWAGDTNSNKAIDPDEIRTLMFFPPAPQWIKDGKFTSDFDLAYSSLLASLHPPPRSDSPEEAARRALVFEELDQGRPTLVYTDLRSVAPNERNAMRAILDATRWVERIFARQTGAAALFPRLNKDDLPSRSLFRRNWGPKCQGPKTEKNPACSAIAGAPKPKVDVYPESLQDEPKFCATLEKRKDAKELLAPFMVLREKDGNLVAQKYSEAYQAPMAQVAEALDRGAGELGPDEKALAEYMRAAAKAFRDNDWESADEAWSKMNAQNSKYYLRIAPDEVYWEPCSQKAGFHVTFARINKESLGWQSKLLPLQQTMEQELAKLIGPPYRERKVSFHLPDFIDIILNAGDDRDPFGATIGQSLPNWGKVANESRGRTVAMSNLYNDPDSRRLHRAQVASLFDKDAVQLVKDDPTAGLLATILHEATHNLGPSHEYKFAGRTDNIAFGGGLASMLEELKAQTGALYYLDLLAKKGVISAELQRQAYVDSVSWAFGHIAQGMWTDDGQRKAYSQLAAIQVGFLMDEGALDYDANALANNGTDKGSFKLHFEKLPAACEKLMKLVGRIKALNDRPGAEALAKKYVDGGKLPQSTITERVLREAKNSFVYSIDL